MTKHGSARNWPKGARPEYRVWLHIRGRCNNPNDAAYHHYGGRGIRVCERWNDYPTFLEDVGERPSRDYTLERVDNDGDYEPGNCIWADRKAQARNRRSTRFVTYRGERMSLAEACERASVPYHTVWGRLRSGEDERTAFRPRGEALA